MAKILVTGGAGFIGSHLSLALKAKGHDVTVLDNLSPQIHGEQRNSYLYERICGKVRFIHGDVRCREDWIRALKEQDVVVHLAAETGTGQSMYEIERYIDVNIKGTGLLAELLTKNESSVRKIILTSSRAVYGEGKYSCEDHGIVYPLARDEKDVRSGDYDVKCPICRSKADVVPTDEASHLSPTSIYGITKHVQEQLLSTVAKTKNISVTVLRYQNVYGPGQSLSNPYTGILSIFSTRMKNGQDINVFEDGHESRDFVYIDDAVAAVMHALDDHAAGCEVFNVGSGISTSVLDVAHALRDRMSAHSQICVSGNCRAGDIRHCVADIRKIGSRYGFVPRYDFVKGISLFADWVSEQETCADRYGESIDEMKKSGLFIG